LALFLLHDGPIVNLARLCYQLTQNSALFILGFHTYPSRVRIHFGTPAPTYYAFDLPLRRPHYETFRIDGRVLIYKANRLPIYELRAVSASWLSPRCAPKFKSVRKESEKAGRAKARGISRLSRQPAQAVGCGCCVGVRKFWQRKNSSEHSRLYCSTPT
jgi:hypothetical protein